MKLSQLTPQDKIKLAAELDGFEDIKFYVLGKAADGITALARSRSADYRCDIPAYATSYDAIIQLIQKQDLSTIIAIQCYVCRTLDCTLVATPSQLLDALLVATGKAEL